MSPENPTTESSSPTTAPLTIEANILDSAKRDDKVAMATMFRQFIGEHETIVGLEYLGTKGILQLGGHSFGCVTERRVASLTVGSFGTMGYLDGYLEHVNSSAFYQPSVLPLYLLVTGLVIGALPTLGLSLLALPFVSTLYYRVRKSGLVFWVREGVPVYLFANRSRLARANSLWRMVADARDVRLKSCRGFA